MTDQITNALQAIKGMNPLLLIILVLMVVLVINSYQEFIREDRMVTFLHEQNRELKMLIASQSRCLEELDED